MSSRFLQMTDELQQYMRQVSLREVEPMKRLREETATMPNGTMQITPEQGQFFAMLVELLNAKKALEIGVFTGYSAISVARALPPTANSSRVMSARISRAWLADIGRRWVWITKLTCAWRPQPTRWTA
jgi:caffeoyl-CoA O-methyltransferase